MICIYSNSIKKNYFICLITQEDISIYFINVFLLVIYYEYYRSARLT